MQQTAAREATSSAETHPAKHPLRGHRACIGIAVGLAITVFVISLLAPRGICFGAIYVIPIIVVQRANSILVTSLTALGCGILASAGIILSPDVGVPVFVILIDYAIALVVLSATALLGVLTNRRTVQLHEAQTLLTMCAWTKQVKIEDEWIPIEEYLRTHSGINITHGVSDEQSKKLVEKLRAKRQQRALD